MAKVEEFLQAHVTVDRIDSVSVISVKEVRELASGKVSIAEYKDPECVARTLACIAMDYLNAN